MGKGKYLLITLIFNYLHNLLIQKEDLFTLNN